MTPETIDHCKIVEDLHPSITEVNHINKTLKGNWTISPKFCHTKGTVAHGGTIAFILDTSMFVLLGALTDQRNGGVSIGLNIQFYNLCRPGKVDVFSKLTKKGKNIAFASCDVFQNSEIIASASQQMKIFNGKQGLNLDIFFASEISHVK